MASNFNLADVPVVKASDLGLIVQHLVDKGQGLALLRGMREDEIRDIEDRLWAEFQGASDARLATALRFRALLQVFASRRLKALFLERGFRVLAAVAREAASRPLNIHFGFNSQRMLTALDLATARSSTIVEHQQMPMAA
jgi:hypothetical protein